MSYFTAEKLGVALARARVAAGLSQVDMARRINKGKATVQSWECGASSPPADKIMDWFEACGTSPLPAMQEMLHPELYKEPIQRKSDEELDEVLTEYFRTAPRIVKEMVLFILWADMAAIHRRCLLRCAQTCILPCRTRYPSAAKYWTTMGSPWLQGQTRSRGKSSLR